MERGVEFHPLEASVAAMVEPSSADILASHSRCSIVSAAPPCNVTTHASTPTNLPQAMAKAHIKTWTTAWLSPKAR